MFPPKPPPPPPAPEKLPPYMEAAGMTAWPAVEEDCHL